MCGRYNIITSAQGLYDAFKILSGDLNFDFTTVNYNIHPSPPAADGNKLVTAPIIRFISDNYEAIPAIWPLIPKWAKGKVSKYSTANARAESLATTKSYKQAWENGQRCLVPATGFYEWQVVEGQKNKQPYNITLLDFPVFAMAGLWELSTDSETKHSVNSFTIITTDANPLMARIHNTKKRMPVIVDPSDYANWLNGKNDEKILTAYPEEKMIAYKVSTAVNNPQFNDASCIKAIDK
jgi:putative SOS response-associated peptidase YedK